MIKKTKFLSNFFGLRFLLFSFTGIVSIVHVSLFAQQYSVFTYGLEEGLHYELIKDINQDKEGFIWIASSGGLIRFDGKSFVSFTDSFPNPYFKGLLKLSNEKLLTYYDLGIVEVFNSNHSTSFPKIAVGAPVLSDSTVRYPKGLYEDSQGSIWVAENQNIVRLMPEGIKRYAYSDIYKSPSFVRSFCFAENDDQTLWVTSYTGYLFYFDREKEDFVQLNKKLPGNEITFFFKKRENVFWAGYEEGVLEISLNDHKEVNSIKKLFTLPYVSSGKRDKNGNVFIGTWNDGLYMVNDINPSKLKKITELPYSTINNIFINEENDIWIATNEGVALLKENMFISPFVPPKIKGIVNIDQNEEREEIYASNTQEVVSLKQEEGRWMEKSLIRADYGHLVRLCNTSEKVYAATSEGAVMSYNFQSGEIKTIQVSKIGSANQLIVSMAVDHQENVWVTQHNHQGVYKITPEDSVYHYGEKEGISSIVNIVKCLENGEVYLCGIGNEGSFLKWNPQKKSFDDLNIHFPFPKEEEIWINDFAEKDNNAILLATNHGLFKFEKKTKTLSNINFKGYENMEGHTIGVVSDDEFWFVNPELGLLNYKSGNLVPLKNKNGLPSKTVNSRAMVIDWKNRLWIGTVRGMVYKEKATGDFPKTLTPKMLSVRVNNEVAKMLNSPAFENNAILASEFISLTYPGEKVEYQYRLNNVQPEWSAPQNENTILVPGLPSGDFKLEIRARQNSGQYWSDPLVYSFSVQKAWYNTWTAWIGYLVAFLLLLLASIRINSYRMKKEEIRLKRIIEERTRLITKQKEELYATLENLKSTQTKLINSEKMASLGVLTAGIAHEINNPVNYINSGIAGLKKSLNHLYVVLREYESIDQENFEEKRKIIGQLKEKYKLEDTLALTEKVLSAIEIGGKRTADIVKELRTFSRIDETEIKKFDVHEGIDSTLILLSSQMKHRIKVVKQYGRIPKIECYAGKLNQVFMNIISNAIDSINGEGEIVISTHNLSEEIMLSIEDTGKGIDRKIRDKVFEPFFTTKEIGKGTGLGLSISYSIIEQHQGRIELKPGKKEGTLVKIWLSKSLNKG
ncbi:sensor histidine kinase [Flexithrix dorotheae]|uniref:sensor histidine kinase n=1 Tax=Flexithrix dorotheae TaxID=70993 RepID=UPI0006944C5A|nr:ATP-binding protein [Flexithrix dorotheae]